jgi:hypothetical protein
MNMLNLQPMYLRKLVYRVTHWESWDWRTKYIPLTPAWVWYCLRSGSWWFFTTSNPTLTFGGFEGESKTEIYNQLPESSYPKTLFVSHGISFGELENAINHRGYQYPLAVKPDVGMKGYLFRKINNRTELMLYHDKVPVDYIVQDYINYPLEVSLFYYRFPNQQKGTITGFIKKESMGVTGDGTSSLLNLIKQHTRARDMLDEMTAKHGKNFDEVIPAGESYILSQAANLNRGGKLIDLSHEKDERLLRVFDDLSHYTKSFFYGRYDIKCQSIDDLKEGRNFSILEFNGSGAEPHHVYGAGYNLVQASRILLHHWDVLYKISKYNHRQGLPYWEFSKGLKFLKDAKRHTKILQKLDSEIVLS